VEVSRAFGESKPGFGPAYAVYIARSRVIARLRELIETVADEPIEPLETLSLHAPVGFDERTETTDGHG